MIIILILLVISIGLNMAGNLVNEPMLGTSLQYASVIATIMAAIQIFGRI